MAFINSNTIAITITGEQGKGKTVTAEKIAKLLRLDGSVAIVTSLDDINMIKNSGYKYVIVDF